MKADTAFPDLVRAANALPYDYANGDGIDYEGFDAFMTPEETAHWFRAWTGNQQADASMLRVFGQDASGGYVAFWCVRETPDLLGQPVVFVGSEGESTVLACHFKDYLALLAAGLGPLEAASYPHDSEVAQPALKQFAEAHAAPLKPWKDVLADAHSEFPDFEQFITSHIPY